MNKGGWFYSKMGRQEGPVTQGVLIELLHSGKLDRDSLVWTDGMDDWAKASSIDGLFLRAQVPHSPMPPNLSPHVRGHAEVGDIVYAGFWRRLVAVFLDGLILAFLGNLVGLVFSALGNPEMAQNLGNLFATLIGWLYFATCESSENQATLGKSVMRIKVTNLEGGRITFAQASGRHFGKILSFLLFFVGFLMVAFTKRKQGLHDMMAGCLVVRR